MANQNASTNQPIPQKAAPPQRKREPKPQTEQRPAETRSPGLEKNIEPGMDESDDLGS